MTLVPQENGAVTLNEVSMKKKFILTQEKQTADLLIANGFALIKQEGKTYAFMNNGKLNFSTEGHKMVYTNLLSV